MRHNHRARRRWSALQRELYDLLEPSIRLQMHCNVYVTRVPFFSGYDVYDEPRHWITLGKPAEIIWDFPGPFMPNHNPNPATQIQYFESAYNNRTWPTRRGSQVSCILRHYIDTPREQLLTNTHEDDRYGLTDILRAADRRIGKRRLRELAERCADNLAAQQVIRARLKFTK